MIVVPAIDVIDGKCVRLRQGDFNKITTYNLKPLDVAKAYEDAGITHLHLVDLEGSKKGKVINHATLYDIAKHTVLHIDFGGGIASIDDVKIVLESGAKQITVGSIAVKNPSLVQSWIEQFGGDRFIIGADCKDSKIAVAAWTSITDIEVVDFIKQYQAMGLDTVICTDISKDGMLMGPSIKLYKDILEQTKCKLIASGGVSSLDDVYALRDIGCHAVIIGKAIYEEKISLKQLSQFILSSK